MMQMNNQKIIPWFYSVLLHGGLGLLLVLSFHWSSSVIPSLGGHNPDAEPVKATVVDQGLIDQQMAMLKAQQQKKQQEKQQLEQNITDLKQQQQTAQQQMNQQLTDLQKQAQGEQDKLAKLKAEDDALSQKKKTTDNAARRRQLQDEITSEEKSRDARLASLQQRYVALITQKVHNNWSPPPSTPDNLNCTVQVTQVRGGTVTNVQVPTCNGDDAVVQSIITAVYRSSPLPEPPDPSLFDRSLSITFNNKKP
ncbi:MAG: cell envelope integrity protein TolA [Gammaproteobacteria bacterium]|jgi:colicin import membrane protein|nr:cell envelope integrity protein TolA [Gammaproteobacteria bacterium]